MKAQLPLAILGGILGAGVGGWAGSLAQMGISFTAGSVLMKYSREAETEADMVGAQIIYDAGYNPRSVVTFFQKLAQQSGGRSGPQFLSSHPDPGNRAQDISKILSRFPPKQFQELDTPEFAAAKKALSDASAGSTEPTEKPVEISRLPLQNIASESFRTFQHKAYAVDYPDNWEVNGDPQASATFYPEGGLAGGALAYGVMVSGFQPSPGGSKELDTAVRELMTDTEQSNPDLRVANSPQAFTLHGRPARKLDWFGKSAVWENGRQLTERVRMIALQEKTGGIIYVVFVAPDPDFSGLLPVFEHMLNSLRIR